MKQRLLHPEVVAYVDHPFWDAPIGQAITFIRISYLVDMNMPNKTPRHEMYERVKLTLQKRNETAYQITQRTSGGFEMITCFDTDKTGCMRHISTWFEQHAIDTFVDWSPMEPPSPSDIRKTSKLGAKTSVLNLKEANSLASSAMISPREARARANYPKQPN